MNHRFKIMGIIAITSSLCFGYSKTESGWPFHNPGLSALSFIIVTVQGHTVLHTTMLDAGKSIHIPSSAVSIHYIIFKGPNAPSNRYILPIN